MILDSIKLCLPAFEPPIFLLRNTNHARGFFGFFWSNYCHGVIVSYPQNYVKGYFATHSPTLPEVSVLWLRYLVGDEKSATPWGGGVVTKRERDKPLSFIFAYHLLYIIPPTVEELPAADPDLFSSQKW